MLPWDVWGAMPEPDDTMDGDRLAFFDRVARLTSEPDQSFEEFRKLFHDDDRLRVPAVVFNAALQRPDLVR
jgi:hypothetical protein